MGPKIYSPKDAVALVPILNAIFNELDRVRDRLKGIKAKMDILEMLWGEEIQSEANPDNREYKHYLEEIDRTRKEFDEVTTKFAEREVLVKSIEQGLVDLYGVIDGRLVFLCWKRGESTVDFYHHLEEGFQGRQQIPAEELAR